MSRSKLEINCYCVVMRSDQLSRDYWVLDGQNLSAEVRSLRFQVRQIVRSAIITGELSPGSLWSVPRLAAKVGVSATPVREALLDLTHDELVEPVRNRGFRVVALSRADLENLIDVRVMVEVPSLVRAVPLAAKGHLAKASGLLKELESISQAGDLIRFVEVHWYFHLALLEPLENPLLRRLVGRLIDQTRLYKLPRLAADGELSTSSHGHGDVLRAVEQGDAEEAGRLMRGHIESDRDLWTELS